MPRCHRGGGGRGELLRESSRCSPKRSEEEGIVEGEKGRKGRGKKKKRRREVSSAEKREERASERFEGDDEKNLTEEREG